MRTVLFFLGLLAGSSCVEPIPSTFHRVETRPDTLSAQPEISLDTLTALPSVADLNPDRCVLSEASRPDTVLDRSVSGVVGLPVRIRAVACTEEGYSYAFETDRQSGEGTYRHFNPPYALLADLDFDGDADLWVSGYPDGGQARTLVSDVWLFDADTNRYVRDERFSSLPNLKLATDARVVESSTICGCAAACWTWTRYEVRDAQPVPLVHQTQECTDDGGRLFRVYERRGESLNLTHELQTHRPNDITDLDIPEHALLDFVDVSAHDL